MSDTQNTHHQGFFSRLFKRNSEPSSTIELEQVIHEASENEVIDEETEGMLHGIFDINRLRISDVMIPTSDIVTINASATIEEAALIISQYGHSRYPVIGPDKDHVIGILLAKDLIPYATGLKNLDDGIKSLLRPTLIVPESKRVNSMLKEFQQKRFHLAIVVDEFGSVSGLVTIEDILEIIVGDIDDEYDTEEECISIKKGKDGKYTVLGVTGLDEFDEFFDTELSDIAEVDTVAGLVTHVLGRFPQVKECIDIGDFQFKVLECTNRQVHLLEVKKITKA
ncbi:MAG: CBS domain-containing protein [Succinivibrio sp.]|jgi:magnesium and cobalt transporter|nr:CBS domain-containing protein [Succinivibrio sp.]